MPGDTVNFTLSYQSGKANLPAAVVESDVQSISFEPEIVERAKEFDGSFKTIQVYDPATDSMVPTQVFIYNELPSVLEPGNAFTVEYKNGAKKRFVSDGRDFVNAQGETRDMYYLHTFSDQMMIPWRDGVNNPLYINYKGAECLVKVRLVAREPWQLFARAWVGDNMFEDGDTVYIEPGKDIFMSFETDNRNPENGVAPFVGFSDGFEGGTLKQAGFVTQSGTAEELGFDEGDVFGLQIGTGNLPVGAEGTLHLYLYELPEDFDMSHFDQSLVEQHKYPELDIIKDNISVLMNIGVLNDRMRDAVEEHDENEVHIAGGYQVLVSQNVIQKHAIPFDSFIVKLKEFVKDKMKGREIE